MFPEEKEEERRRRRRIREGRIGGMEERQEFKLKIADNILKLEDVSSQMVSPS